MRQVALLRSFLATFGWIASKRSCLRNSVKRPAPVALGAGRILSFKPDDVFAVRPRFFYAEIDSVRDRKIGFKDLLEQKRDRPAIHYQVMKTISKPVSFIADP